MSKKSLLEGAELGVPARRLFELMQSLAKRGVSQAQVARRANVPPQYVSDVRHQRRPMTELFARRLAEEFHVNFEWLMGLVDSPERVVLSAPPTTGERVWLPMIGEVVGDPRTYPRWNCAYYELSGIAATKAAQADQPYVLQIGHHDQERRFRKGDLMLVSQAASKTAEVNVVRCGKKVLLARQKGAQWQRADNGETLQGDCSVIGHCLGVIWSALI